MSIVSPRIQSCTLVALAAFVVAGCGTVQPAPTSDSANGPREPSVERLVFATTAPPVEGNETRHTSPPSNWHLRPMYEYLIGIDASTGKMLPQLATEWKLEPDGTSFRFKLKQGIPFHKGYGEFTARDLTNPWREVIKDDSLAGTAQYWRLVMRDIEAVGAHEAVYHLKRPDGSFLYSMSYGRAAMEMYAKQHFDQAGPPTALEVGPIAGTGPYQFQARSQAAFIRYERTPGEHWRITPAFKEFEFRFMKEASTRLAALLAGEVHLADLPQDLRVQAKQRGMVGITAKASSLRTWMSHLCCYLNDPADPQKGWAHPESPLLDVRVRRALSKAINRDDLNRGFLRGEGQPMVLPHFSPTRDGWDATWERRFQEQYGFDQAAARRLLTEAGYGSERPFTTNLQIQSASGYTGAEDIAEAIAGMWRAVGVNVVLTTLERTEFERQSRTFKFDNHTLINASGSEQWTGSTAYGTTQGARWGGVDAPKVNPLLGRIGTTLDQREQDRLWREVGEELFVSHKEIPLFWLPIEVVVDPKVVGEWVFPGSLTGSWTHVENIRPAR